MFHIWNIMEPLLHIDLMIESNIFGQHIKGQLCKLTTHVLTKMGIII
jgi:hypothetical protein